MRFLAVIALAAFAAACGPTPNKEAAQSSVATPPAVTVPLFGAGATAAFEARPGNTVTPVQDATGAVTSVVMASSVRGNQALGDGNSIYVRVPPQLSSAAAGKAVTIKVSAKTIESGSAPTFYVAYTRPGVTSSGWQEFRPTAEFTEQSMTYVLPADLTGMKMDDLLVVYADAEGKGRGVEINAVTATYTP